MSRSYDANEGEADAMREPLKRVGLIGPVLPFRGGIAQHTTMLRRALVSRCDLLTVSFTRQYPRWLFPGVSDRDPQYAGYTEKGVAYVVDSLNPLTWKRAVRIMLKHNVECVLIPWWTIFWAPFVLYVTRVLAARGVRIVLLCHNTVDHEAARWKVALSRRVLHRASGFIVHTRADQKKLRGLVGNLPVIVSPLPIYSQYDTSAGDNLPRSGSLELLFFGFVRHYKGLDVLLQALGQMQNRDFFLRVVGEFWERRQEYDALVSKYGLTDRVEIVPRYVSEQEAASYFRRADFVVLPYRSATGSAVIGVAFHFDKPVVVTRVGGLPDVVTEGETGFIVPPESPDALVALMNNLSAAMASNMAEKVRQHKSTMTWDALAQAFFDVCAPGSQ
jgi:glycosyltransferase involved in cell wall biosynthesis